MLLAVLLIVTAIFSIVAICFGWDVKIIQSGSMEPALPVGGVVITRPVAPQDIKVGDIIMFDSPYGSSITCRRVVQVETEPSLRFVTKGDANPAADSDPVLASQVNGVSFLAIPYIGYALEFIITLPGLLAILIVVGLLIIRSEWDLIREYWRSEKNDNPEEDQVPSIAPLEPVIDAQNTADDDQEPIVTDSEPAPKVHKPAIAFNPGLSLKRLGSIIGTLLAVTLIVTAIFPVVAPIFGWNVKVVLSGSMGSALPVGGVVIAGPIAPQDIKVGDIIMYSSLSGNFYTSHRVVQVLSQPTLSFVTQGDMNQHPDPSPILPGQVMGKCHIALPYLGYLIMYIRTLPGLLIVIIIPGLLLILSELDLPGYWRSWKARKKTE